MNIHFPTPTVQASNHNIFQIINFKIYEALPRWVQNHPDPMFMTNIARITNQIAWHSLYRTVYPHSLQYMALRAITLDDIPALTKILKNRKFDVNGLVDRKYQLTPLQYAAMKNKFPIIQLLLMYGANINKSDAQGNTPLMLAVSNYSLQSINTLLKNGCDRNIANQYGIKPKQRAMDEDSQYIADFINSYPQTSRKFPKFTVKLDIQKKINSPISQFLLNYKIYQKKPLKSPFNNFKGQYKIMLNNSKTIADLISQIKRQKQ